MKNCIMMKLKSQPRRLDSSKRVSAIPGAVQVNRRGCDGGHIYMLLMISPKCSVVDAVGFFEREIGSSNIQRLPTGNRHGITVLAQLV